MNKRARLTRRILRDHRQGQVVHSHWECTYRSSGGVEIWDFWTCPHCPKQYSLIPMGPPHAYR